MLKKLWAAAGMALVSTIVAGGLWASGVLDTFELSSLSLRANLLSSRSQESGQVKLILLDQASLDWASQENHLNWPWPRQAYVPILQFCQRAGVKAVGLDVLYTEPSAYSVDDDLQLAKAMEETTRLSAALFLSNAKQPGLESGDETIDWPFDVNVIFDNPETLTAALDAVTRSTVQMPIPALRNAVDSMGNVSELPGRDGVFRELSFFNIYNGEWIPSLGLSLFMLTQGEDEFEFNENQVQYQGQAYPINSALRARLRFRAAPAFSRYSAAAIIESELRLQSGREPIINPEELSDAYILFGFSAPGLKDLRPTPLNPAAPGVLLHATFLDNLLQRDFLRSASLWGVWTVGLGLAWLAAWGILLSDKGWKMVLVLTAMLPLPFLFSLVAYDAGVEWPFVCFQSQVMLAMGGAMVASYALEGRQKRFIKNAFRYYLSPAVIDQMTEHPDRLKLGGERKELSIFFSDIEGFSGISEFMDPETLTALLNDYLSLLAGIIKEEGGTVDKFIGDAIVAFWNAPLDQTDHAERALRAAVKCQRALHQKEKEYEGEYGAKLVTRIGVHTGVVTVGNMGSRDRFDYSMLGDAANLASRLEGVNKVFGTKILVSDSTWKHVGEEQPGRFIGKVKVVGRSEPVGIYEPFVTDSSYSPQHLETFDAALKDVEAGQLVEAVKKFERLSNDPAAEAYVETCKQYLQKGETWTGVWALTSK